MDQNNPIIPTATPGNTEPQQTTIPRGASYDSISPEAQYASAIANNPLINKPTAFKTGQNDWSRFNPQQESIPKDQGSAAIYKYLDPTEYKNLQQKPVEKTGNSGFINAESQKVKSIVRTFKNDIEEAVKYNHVSSIDIALAEQRKQQQIVSSMLPSKSPDINSFKIIIYTILGLIFLSGGGFVAYYLLNSEVKLPTGVLPDTSVTKPTATGYNLIRTERQEEKNLDTIDTTKLSVVLRNTLETTSLPPNSMEEILVTKNISGTTNSSVITAKEFLNLNSIILPDDLSRDLQNSFSYGFYSMGGNQPYLIFKTSTYQTSYPGMWSWQKGTMIQDLKKIFPINTNYLTSMASGTVQQRNYLPVFTDIPINNIDSFILKDVYNRPALTYTIFDKTTIIVSTNPETVGAIITRLLSAKSQQR